MPLKLYFDEDSLRTAVARSLRDSGVDLVRSSDVGNQLLSDEEQLEFAVRERRMIYSANIRDFAPLHQRWMEAGREHFGILVRYRQQVSIGVEIQAIRSIVAHLNEEQAANSFIFLENWM